MLKSYIFAMLSTIFIFEIELLNYVGNYEKTRISQKDNDLRSI